MPRVRLWKSILGNSFLIHANNKISNHKHLASASGLDDRHLEFRLAVWCGNVGHGATEMPDPENMVLWFEIALLAPPQAEI